MSAHQSIKAAIIGASGYGGAELARLLANHPYADLTIATASGDRAGARLSDLFPSLRGICDIACTAYDAAAVAADCQVAFIALAHGKAMEIAPELLEAGVKVIDIGADFRLRDFEIFEQWYKCAHTARTSLNEAVYGLPEWNRAAIVAARLVANPGCYPTSAILALAPFVAAGVIDNGSIIVDSASGTSGAGRSSFGIGMHHPEVSDDFKAYNVTTHRHTPEIEQGLADVAPAGAVPVRVTFTAHLLPIARGILSTCYASLQPGINIDATAARQILVDKYASEPFVRISHSDELPQIKHAAGSNFCDVGVRVDARTNRLIVMAAEDNLIKGAAGQAIQNMNLMCGFPETTALLAAAPFP